MLKMIDVVTFERASVGTGVHSEVVVLSPLRSHLPDVVQPHLVQIGPCQMVVGARVKW